MHEAFFLKGAQDKRMGRLSNLTRCSRCFQSPPWPAHQASLSHLEAGGVAAHVQDHIVGSEIEEPLLPFGNAVSFRFMQGLLLHRHRHMSVLQDPARWKERGWMTPCWEKKDILQGRLLH